MNDYKNLKERAWEDQVRDISLDYFSGSEETKTRPDMTKILLNLRDQYGGHLPLPYFATPDEVICPYEGDVAFGRKKVEFPVKTVQPHEWGRRTRFSVEAMTAISTNFLGSAGSNDGVASVVFPQLLSNVRRIELDENVNANLLIADGGTNDLFGILPAVQQKVDKIISVYNFNQNPPYADFQTTYADIYKQAPCTDRNDPNFNTHFRNWLKMINPRLTCYFGYYGPSVINHSNLPNHVFNDDNLDHLKDLMVKFNSLHEAGEPLIATMRGLETIDNPFWGIDAGQKVDLTLIWFHMPKKFSEKVPAKLGFGLDEDGRFEENDMKYLPELPNDPLTSLTYSPQQINMMAYLGSWMVHRSWHGLVGHDGEEKFEGFANILGDVNISNGATVTEREVVPQ